MDSEASSEEVSPLNSCAAGDLGSSALLQLKDHQDMFMLLPGLCCAKVAQQVLINQGNLQFFRLRSCSQTWKSVCDEQLHGIILCVADLADEIPFLNSLPSLTSLTITANENNETLLQSNALGSLTVNLKNLAVTSGNAADAEALRVPKIIVENFGELVQPWQQSLGSLSLQDCVISPTDEGKFTSEGFFAQFPQLTELRLVNVRATPGFNSLNLEGCTKLTILECSDCGLTSLNIASCKGLTFLSCVRNSLPTIDVSAHAALDVLCFTDNLLTVLDLSGCPLLRYLSIVSNSLQYLQLSSCHLLLHVDCDYNDLRSLDLSACVELECLNCTHNNICHLNALACSNMTVLRCEKNQLIELDLSACAFLKELDCRDNQLGDIHLHAHANIDKMQCENNQACRFVSHGNILDEINCRATA